MFSSASPSNEDIGQGSVMNDPQSYEKSEQKPLKDIPVIITLDGRSYLLAAAILFAPPSNATGLGHYIAAVRINDKFEVYDDLRPNTFTIGNDLPVCIHCLLYVSPNK